MRIGSDGGNWRALGWRWMCRGGVRTVDDDSDTSHYGGGGGQYQAAPMGFRSLQVVGSEAPVGSGSLKMVGLAALKNEGVMQVGLPGSSKEVVAECGEAGGRLALGMAGVVQAGGIVGLLAARFGLGDMRVAFNLFNHIPLWWLATRKSGLRSSFAGSRWNSDYSSIGIGTGCDVS